MVLLVPVYQLIARACWRYSLADLLDPTAWWAKWSEVADEIRSFHANQALREAAENRSADAKDATGSASLVRRLLRRRTAGAQRRRF